MKISDIIALTVLTILFIVVLVSLKVRTVTPWAVVGSYSMEPVLRLGDVVIIGNVNDCDLLGKVIIYRGPISEYIVHRVVRVLNPNECVVVTKGDANPRTDPWSVDSDNIIGVVLVSIPYVGLVNLIIKSIFMSTGYGPLPLILLILVGITLYIIFTILERNLK